MKTLNYQQLETITILHGGELTLNPLPRLDFGGSGFEATETGQNDDWYGFVFYGDTDMQSALLPVWNALTTEHSFKPLLTVEAAEKLIGKTVICRYSDVNHGTCKFKIIGLEKEKRAQIGQDENYILVTQDFVPAKYKTKEEYAHLEQGDGIHNKGSFVALNEKLEILIYMSKDNIGKSTFDFVPVEESPRHELIAEEELNDQESRWAYEWDGIFRYGSGAERLFIEEVLTQTYEIL